MFFQIAAGLADILSVMVFMLLLLVLAQGWTITRFEVLRPKLLLAGVLLVGVFQVGFVLWRLLGLDEDTIKYYYNTAPMIAYAAFMALVGCYFFAQSIYCYKNEPLDSKRNLFLTVERLSCLCLTSTSVTTVTSRRVRRRTYGRFAHASITSLSLCSYLSFCCS